MFPSVVLAKTALDQSQRYSETLRNERRTGLLQSNRIRQAEYDMLSEMAEEGMTQVSQDDDSEHEQEQESIPISLEHPQTKFVQLRIVSNALSLLLKRPVFVIGREYSLLLARRLERESFLLFANSKVVPLLIVQGNSAFELWVRIFSQPLDGMNAVIQFAFECSLCSLVQDGLPILVQKRRLALESVGAFITGVGTSQTCVSIKGTNAFFFGEAWLIYDSSLEATTKHWLLGHVKSHAFIGSFCASVAKIPLLGQELLATAVVDEIPLAIQAYDQEIQQTPTLYIPLAVVPSGSVAVPSVTVQSLRTG